MSDERVGRDAVAVLRDTQRALHAGGGRDSEMLIRELDKIASAIAILPDLHAQVSRRYEVLFPSVGREAR